MRANVRSCFPKTAPAVEGRGADLYLGAYGQQCSRPGAHAPVNALHLNIAGRRAHSIAKNIRGEALHQAI